jgi:hypothetical protein
MVRAFCSGVTRAKIVVPANIWVSCSFAQGGGLRPGENARNVETQFAADGARGAVAVAVTSLTVTPSCAKRGRRPAHLREYDQIRPHGDIVKLRQHVQRGRSVAILAVSPNAAVANLAQQSALRRERNGDPER